MLILGLLTIAIYFCVLVQIALQFFWDNAFSFGEKSLKSLIVSAMVLHFLILTYQVNLSLEAIDLGVFKALSLTSLLMLGITLSFFRQKEVLMLSLSFAILSIVLSFLFVATQTVSLFNQWLLSVHIISSMIAYALMILMIIEGSLLLLRDVFLKRHTQITWIKRLPPIMQIEQWFFKLLNYAFGFLCLSLLSGMVFLDQWFSQHYIHKTIFSLLAWILLVFLLIAHHFYGVRGRRSVYWALAVFILLMLGFVGTKIVQQLILI